TEMPRLARPGAIPVRGRRWEAAWHWLRRRERLLAGDRRRSVLRQRFSHLGRYLARLSRLPRRAQRVVQEQKTTLFALHRRSCQAATQHTGHLPKMLHSSTVG